MIELGVIIAVLVGLGQIAKQIGVPNKYLPVLSLVLGVAGGIFFGDASAIQDRVILGLMVGLSASGLYDQSKIITKK